MCMLLLSRSTDRLGKRPRVFLRQPMNYTRWRAPKPSDEGIGDTFVPVPLIEHAGSSRQWQRTRYQSLMDDGRQPDASCRRPGVTRDGPRAQAVGEFATLLKNAGCRRYIQECPVSEQKRIAKELDQLVAEWTRELAEANEALKQELVVERQRTETARRASDLDARLILNSIPGLVSILTPTGDVEFVNDQVVEYGGRTVEELKKWGNSDAVHPYDLSCITQT